MQRHTAEQLKVAAQVWQPTSRKEALSLLYRTALLIMATSGCQEELHAAQMELRDTRTRLEQSISQSSILKAESQVRPFFLDLALPLHFTSSIECD